MSSLPLVGDELAGYRILAVAGRGRTSVVYQAENPRLGNVVALKVLAPELAADGVFRARFLGDSRIAASLNHPHVIPIHDVGSSDEAPYIAMRYVAGTDLRLLLGKRGRIPPRTAVFLLTQAARALDAAHANGLVHRDVKPANLLIEHGGADPDHVYLADFGMFPGAVGYVAPEQILGLSVLGLADQYSLGCVLYQCLTGRVPFGRDHGTAATWAHAGECPAPPSALCPDLPRGADPVFSRVLARQPGDRYRSCREFMAAAAGALGTGESRPAPGRPPAAAARVAKAAVAAVPATAAVPAMEPLPARRDFELAHNGAAAVAHWPDDGTAPGLGGGDPGGAPRSWPRGGRRARPAAFAAALVLAAAIAFIVGRGGGGHAIAANDSAVSSSAAPVDMPQPTPGARARVTARAAPAAARSALMTALVQANTITGKLPPARCSQQGAAKVTCTDPVPGVAEAVFETYPSLPALYAAYEAAIRSVDGGRVPQNVQDCGLAAPQPTGGEVGWNHEFQHPKNYTIAQMSAGKVTEAQAAGRVFCITDATTGVVDFIWTQDVGRLLAWVVGPLHEQVWYWWLSIHHEISIGEPPMTMPVP